MNSLWNKTEAKALGNDPLKLRVYSSRLLGAESSLVLHGGGNTSVKASITDFFGDMVDILYIKGSGWDLATIEAAGFAPVRLDALKRLAGLPLLSDADMVRQQRAAMIDPQAPTPSVEAILHAIIPYRFVDHTHADAVVAITNTPDGLRRVKEVYGNRLLIVPYVMPGFVLARKVYEMTRQLDWSTCEGILLMNHGLFTFAQEAKDSYEKHIRLVDEAEKYIKQQNITIAADKPIAPSLEVLASLRREVSRLQGGAVVAMLKNDARSCGFANLPKVSTVASRGTLTPDHVIRTKPIPVVLSPRPVEEDVAAYARAYQKYFDTNTDGKLKSLDLAPRWAVWPGHGCVSFGRSINDASITADIIDHTIIAIQWAEGMGGWKVLTTKDIFAMEYWELEQAKLAKGSKPAPLQGKIALVTGAASGIGRACVDDFIAQGAHVIAVDINPEIRTQFKSKQVVGVVADLTKGKDILAAVEAAIKNFGGLDIVVSNAGIFPESATLKDMPVESWEASLAINLTSHQRLLSAAIRYLEFGIDPTVIIIGSKNVPAPGPGAGAYSVAKAGLAQMARVAALELGGKGIRVNVVHPNQVFDTAIWTPDVLAKRAKSYNLSVEEYKTNNILKTEITSKDVATLIINLAGPVFAKTTGAQIPIDGGNDRVI